MNAVLFDEFPILVDRVLAEKIGLNEAIVIQQLHYWIMQNKRQNKNFIDGKYWTYNSFEKWHKETFYFWSIDTVKRTFKKLEKSNLIITSNYNKKAYDRTKWYSINYEKLRETIENGHKGNLHQCIDADCTDALGQNASMDKGILHRPIPKTNTDTKTDTKPPLEVVDKIKQYFVLEEKDIKKVANAHLATSKEISYLVEKLELTKSKDNIQDVTAYLIAALKNDYKGSISNYKCFIPRFSKEELEGALGKTNSCLENYEFKSQNMLKQFRENRN